jgi:hypothetical protein
VARRTRVPPRDTRLTTAQRQPRLGGSSRTTTAARRHPTVRRQPQPQSALSAPGRATVSANGCGLSRSLGPFASCPINPGRRRVDTAEAGTQCPAHPVLFSWEKRAIGHVRRERSTRPPRVEIDTPIKFACAVDAGSGNAAVAHTRDGRSQPDRDASDHRRLRKATWTIARLSTAPTNSATSRCDSTQWRTQSPRTTSA